MNNDYPSPNSRRKLFRDPSRGKIFGVCAGIADYFGLEVWVVRIIAVTVLLFFQFPIFISYIIAYFVLEPKPGTGNADKDNRSSSKGRKNSDDVSATVQQVWKKGRIPGQTLRNLNRRFKSLETRLQLMESYVTSKQFELRKEFQELSS